MKRIDKTFGKIEVHKAQAIIQTGDAEAFKTYVADVAGDQDFSIFYAADQGAAMTLMGHSIKSHLFLIGNAISAAGLYKFEPGSGLLHH